jgi:hypothetical protein
MVTDQQVRRLFKMSQKEKTFAIAASKAGMDEKTARKYCRLGKLPSEVEADHTWRTREDPFKDVWEEVREMLEVNPGLEAVTLFMYLQRKYPGRFSDGQLRTLQRRFKHWRATEGPPKEVYFAQKYYPGVMSESDFTCMNKLGITIARQPFAHLLYHFVLPYSNWETGNICFSESFESLSEGLQHALWKLGGVPREHRIDQMSSAVTKLKDPEVFTQRYKALLKHYGFSGRIIQVDKPHENGDVEQRHYRLKKALEQSFMLRGGRDFETRKAYQAFVDQLFDQLNAGRQSRFREEVASLQSLPSRRLEASKKESCRVTTGSTIWVRNNVYSVNSRLIGEKVEVRLFAEKLEVWYAQRKQEELPRLRGTGGSYIQYRHIIDWLVRKPGAFENYRYREDLFPTSRFRMAYDHLKVHRPARASREYLKILWLAAKRSEVRVDEALRIFIEKGLPITSEAIEDLLDAGGKMPSATEIRIAPVELGIYDALLEVGHGTA